MAETIRIGLDRAKIIFQVHGVNAQEQVTIRRSFRRDQLLRWFERLSPCLVGMEACATAHYSARELTRLGHTVRLIPPAYVKAYVRRNKKRCRRRRRDLRGGEPSPRSVSSPPRPRSSR